MSTKRTIINADEELVIKGKLTIEGNVTQIETTHQVTNLEGNIFTINSDGSDTSAVLALNSNGTVATMTFDDAVDKLVVNKTIVVTAFGNIETTGNVNAGWFHGDGSNITGLTTTIVAEGTNLYFTSARVRGNISVSDEGGDGALYYSNANGVITYVGPSQNEANARIDSAPANVRAHFSATDGITYDLANGVFTLTSTSAGDGLTYTNGILAVGAGDGITVNADNVAVNNTVIRITGDQTITGNTTFVGNITILDNNVANEYAILPSNANVVNLGSWANHFNYVFANTVHAEHLDLSDANIADIHSRFVAGVVDTPYITTNTANGLLYTHNSTIAGYAVVAGDGIIADSNVSVDSTVIRTTGDQTITGNTLFDGNVSITGNLDVTANINSLTVVDLLVQDANIVLRSNSVSDGNAHILVERGNVADSYINWDAQDDAWKFSNDGTIEYRIPTSTNDLIEGNANLYFTTDRVNTAIDAYVVGGDGLTYTSGNINVGAGDGITVNADNVAVDTSVVRTSGNQSISGIKNFTGELVIPSSLPTSNNTIYVNAGNTAVYAYVNGVHVQLTADSDVGQVEDVGNVGINIYAGSRSVVLGNNTVYYHGIKSIDAGSYLDISEASNVITVAGNAAGIRGLISTSGNLSYDSANGIISENLTTTDIEEGNNLYFTASRVRGNISSTGLITYDSANGIIGTTADLYNNWDIQTDSGVGAKHSVTSNSTVIVQGGTGITVTNSNGNITIASTSSADITEVAAGNGLTGGGIAGSVTLDIGAGTGILVNADDIAVNSSYIKGLISVNDVSGDGSLSYDNANGVITYTGPSASEVRTHISVTDAGGDGSLSYDNANGVITYTGPSQAEANARMDAYLVGGAGLTYTSGTFAIGSGFGITVNADNIEVSNANIRSLFSATSPLSYDSANGIFSIAEVGDISEVVAGNGLVGGGSSGSVTLDIGAGTGITVNADNVSVNMSAFTTTDLAEGANLYYTAARANSAMDAYLVGGSGLTYSAGTFNVGAGSYITVGANDVAVDATSTNTANKIVARDASGNFAANVITATATSARYADLAENYLGDADYLPGTVLVFGGEAEVTACMSYESTRVAGVVTTQPAHVMNSDLTGNHVTCIALRGRVPVKVKGVVRKGDVLVTAGEGHIGYAVASLDPRGVPAAAVVGKAITDKLDSGSGVVEALI